MMSDTLLASIQKKVEETGPLFDETIAWAMRNANKNEVVRNAINRFDENMTRAIAQETLRLAYDQNKMSTLQKDEYLIMVLRNYE